MAPTAPLFLTLFMVLLSQARSYNAVSTLPFCTQEMADEAVYRALSLFIGDGRRYSVEDIEIGVPGLKARTVSSWIANSAENRRAPKARDLIRIAHFLGDDGPTFLSKVYGCVGLRVMHQTPQPNEPAVIVARLMAGAATYAELGKDGRYCHRDRPLLERATDDMMDAMSAFVVGPRGAR